MANAEACAMNDPELMSKDELELSRLRHEIAESRRPWLLRIAVPALLAALASGTGGYLFGDSLAERSRAEIRKDVLAKYWAVDNEQAGKRSQILNFILETVGNDDADLARRATSERKIVDH